MNFIKAAVLIKKEDKYLLVQEKAKRSYGLWNWPQGKVKEGELPEQAAIREAQEETGFNIKIIRKVEVLEKTFSDTKELHVFLGEIVDGELNFPEDEILDIKWFAPDEIETMKEKLVGQWVFETVKLVK